MDIAEVEENHFAASDAKLHGGMCRALSAIYCRVLEIFPLIEEARPRSKPGIQSLCSLHLALEKAKNILQHCSECSKLYLAITGDSVVLKFEKARFALADSLRRVLDNIPEAIGCRITEIISELDGTAFSLDPSEKQVGDEIITLLQQRRKFDHDSSDHIELELFHQAALKLGITSSRAALIERRSLKKLVEKAHVEEDSRKESIVVYLLHLMRKYSKLFRSEFSDDIDSQGSSPRSPTVKEPLENGSGPLGCGLFYERQLSKLVSFNFKHNNGVPGNVPLPPEELRCPMSLQLMYDPVIISSGQTYERACIEKWFGNGHDTCPKTQQQLSHLGFIPNYCVKGLVMNWCEQNGVPAPGGPPESPDVNYWRLAMSESECVNSKSMESIGVCRLEGEKAVPLKENGGVGEAEGVASQDDEHDFNPLGNCQGFLNILNEEDDLGKKCEVVELIRHLLKDDEDARIFMGANGFVEALVQFLDSALREGNEMAQEVGAMALFNLGVNNNRNNEMMLCAGVIPLLGEMISYPNSHGSVTALYLNLSCLEEAKLIIGSSQAVPFLVNLLQSETEPQCKHDALHVLYNLSTQPSNISPLLEAGIVDALCSLLMVQDGHVWADKSIAILINLASCGSGKAEMSCAPGLIIGLAAVLESGEPSEQEQAVSCLLMLSTGDEKCSQLILEEGVIPTLVSISVNGTARGREKARRLLLLFREQRQREASSSASVVETRGRAMIGPSKSLPRKKIGRAWTGLWKSKTIST